jgi:molecular chaperone GrpE
VAKKETEQKEIPVEETPLEQEVAEETAETAEAAEAAPEVNPWEEKYNAERDAHLRIAAEFDNFRKRTIKEKEASYGNGKADAVAKMLPVYDNLERALQQETADAAFKKGVEMTMTELVKIFSTLGVEIFGNVGEQFDPNLHNAVMHTENPDLGENTISMVFQKGFKIGDKVVRFAMVQVAN